VQGLVDILEDVVQRLETDRHPDHVRRHAGSRLQRDAGVVRNGGDGLDVDDFDGRVAERLGIRKLGLRRDRAAKASSSRATLMRERCTLRGGTPSRAPDL
jgi:hypothetical protein